MRLPSQVQEVVGLHWDCNTNFNAVFALLLQVLLFPIATAHAASLPVWCMQTQSL